MLHKITQYVFMIVLFALTQIGAVTHEFSHYSAPAQHSQQDQHTAPDQCSQCIGYAHAATGVLTDHFVLTSDLASFQLNTSYTTQATYLLSVAYSARAPPSTLI
jgi:hypothetical protein